MVDAAASTYQNAVVVIGVKDAALAKKANITELPLLGEMFIPSVKWMMSTSVIQIPPPLKTSIPAPVAMVPL